MDHCSYFIKDRALFGSFPTQDSVNELEKEGVKYFINLTHSHEKKIIPYETHYTKIEYPIVDRRTPSDCHTFCNFITQVSKHILTLKKGEKVYVHCKGGHGRSGIVVACLLCYIFKIKPDDALKKTTRCHSKRSVMREKWRTIGSPQTLSQKNFVHRLFEPLYFYKAYKIGSTVGFSNCSRHSVSIKGFGYFPTAEAAFQAYKDPSNKQYVHSLKISKTALIAKSIGENEDSRCLREDWDEIKTYILYKIIKLKFTQNDNIRINLLTTGFRPILERSTLTTIDTDKMYNGKNVFGSLLTKFRNKLYQDI
jgi:ribA/ribD-fused uncharacterized protein